jgi:MarR family transcriptional repressor of mepA
MPDKSQKFQEMNRLLRTYWFFLRRFYGNEIKFTTLTPQQGRTLMFIDKHPGVIQRELADIFHLRNASVTNMVKNLERDGYLERRRDENSARIKRLYLTEYGKKDVAAMRKNFAGIVKKLSDRVDEELLDQLVPLLKQFNEQIQKEDY